MLALIILIALLAIILSPLILVILLLLAPLRFGAIVEYSDAGINLWIKATFLKLQLLGKEKKRRKNEKKPKKRKKEKSSIDFSVLKPGSLKEFMDILKTVGNVLNRLKRKLLIKELKLYYVSASDDSAKTAMQLGAASAAFEAIVPLLKRNFRIRRLDLKASADFTSANQQIYAKLNISMAVWEAVYIALALLPFIKSIFKRKPNTDGTEDTVKDDDKIDKNIDSEKQNDSKRKDGEKDNGKE